jgi:RimJ/RimL family protein N-acetyltransferase
LPNNKQILQTERISLTEANLSDAPFIFDLLNSPNWLEFIGDRSIKSLEDAEKYIQDSLLKSYQENGFGLWRMELKSKNIPIGLCGLLKRETLDFPDLGFAILPDYEGFGYMSEVAKVTVSHAKTSLKLEQVLATTTPTNLASQKVLLKTGFKRVREIEMNKEIVYLYSLGL